MAYIVCCCLFFFVFDSFVCKVASWVNRVLPLLSTGGFRAEAVRKRRNPAESGRKRQNPAGSGRFRQNPAEIAPVHSGLLLHSVRACCYVFSRFLHIFSSNSVLCYVMMFSSVLCYVLLCCSVVCCDVVYYDCNMLWAAMPLMHLLCIGVLCYAMLRCSIWWDACDLILLRSTMFVIVLCCTMWVYVVFCYVM